eukprot:gnl/MRDRNA2_/MRDRNA2_574848_c0_seq1.p1 gnl/MRDRNA2_/MRDRNA2_574848_c0~~gnl/MRDRNA2_/MRDRNA2_574848_c0_seq1.p1  ORF type:complete len:132 (+),score=22.29 gnl/MRDRNA2_/MRDRNA2_574848_c0_seq1:14-409(+)
MTKTSWRPVWITPEQDLKVTRNLHLKLESVTDNVSKGSDDFPEMVGIYHGIDSSSSRLALSPRLANMVPVPLGSHKEVRKALDSTISSDSIESDRSEWCSILASLALQRRLAQSDTGDEVQALQINADDAA